MDPTPARLLPVLILFLAACGTESPAPEEAGPDLGAGATVSERIVYYDSLGEKGMVENVPQLERAIGRDHVEVQLTVIDALHRIGAPEVIPALEKAAGDELSRVRMTVARAAGSVRSLESLALLERLCRDPAPKVRRAAVASIAMVALPESVPFLLEVARDEQDETTRRGAVWALGQVGPPAVAAIPLLVELATTENERTRWDCIESMLAIGGDRAVLALLAQLASDLPEVRGRAALALAELDSTESLGDILDALAVEDAEAAEAPMARAAALLGDREVSIPILERLLLTGNHWAPRVESALALGESGDQACLPTLQEAGADPNSLVRQKAAEAIKLIRSREAAS